MDLPEEDRWNQVVDDFTEHFKKMETNPITLEVFNASENSFGVASVIVSGKTDAVLIDAQFTLADAELVAQKIKTSGKKLTSIYVSYGDPDFYFGLEVLEIGQDEDNEPITSCVIRAIDASGEMKRVLPPNAGNQKIAYDTIKELLKKAGDIRPSDAPIELPKGRPCIKLDFAINKVCERLIIEVEKRKVERTQAAITGLVNRGLIVMREGYLWLV